MYEKMDDGILLCKMINLASLDTIDERVINKGQKLSIFKVNRNSRLKTTKCFLSSNMRIWLWPSTLPKPLAVLSLVLTVTLLTQVRVRNGWYLAWSGSSSRCICSRGSMSLRFLVLSTFSGMERISVNSSNCLQSNFFSDGSIFNWKR